MEANTSVIKAPAVSFLSNEEEEWLRFINLREWWEREDQEEYLEATDHIVSLLHRVLDVLHESPDKSAKVFNEITEMVNDRLKGIGHFLVPNPHYTADADWTDPFQMISANPFLFANIEGVAGMYASLGRFLASPSVHRLSRCGTCHGLFLAPHEGPSSAVRRTRPPSVDDISDYPTDHFQQGGHFIRTQNL